MKQQWGNRFLIICFITLVTNSTIQAQTAEQPATPGQMVDALHSAFGKHPARAVHAKGIFFEGRFIPDKDAAAISSAFHLQKQSSTVVVRFSDFTGIPDIPDNIGPANPRGFALKFKMPDGRSTDIIAHSFNGFPTATTDEFRLLLLAIGRSGADAAKPTALDSFLNTHPIAKTFLTTQKLPASYAAISYFGVNSFKFLNHKGQSHFIRYQILPEKGEELMDVAKFAEQDKDYLVTEIGKRITAGPVRFKLYAQLAAEGDAIENPAIAWPDTRKKVLLGIIEINKLIENTPLADKSLSFNPNNLPEDIQTADPMLTIRAKAYPISVKERQ
jgi:catalase